MGSIAYLSGAPFFNPGFQQESCCSILSFCVVFYRPFVVPLGLFSFGHCIVCPPIDGFRLFLCFLQIVPQVYHKSRISMADYQVIIRKAWPWTIVGNVFGECHDPCMQHDLYCRFCLRAGALQPLKETTLFVRTQISMLSVGVTTLNREHISSLISTQFLYNNEFVLVLNIAQIPLEGR